MDYSKYGWCSPEGEIIPLLPVKEHLETITTYADKHGIYYDYYSSIYFYFVGLGFSWFTDYNIVTKENTPDENIKKIKDFIGKEDVPISIWKEEELKR